MAGFRSVQPHSRVPEEVGKACLPGEPAHSSARSPPTRVSVCQLAAATPTACVASSSHLGVMNFKADAWLCVVFLPKWQRLCSYASDYLQPSLKHMSHRCLLIACESEEVASSEPTFCGFCILNLTLTALAPILKSIQTLPVMSPCRRHRAGLRRGLGGLSPTPG